MFISLKKSASNWSYFWGALRSLLYLPPYSPDLNPIEKKWAQAKHIRRTLTCSIDHLFQFHLP
jgi:transposase